MLGRAIRLAILIGVLVPASASAGIRATVVGNFDAPTYIAAPPGDTHRLFVVEQSGVIELIKDGGMPTAFLDVSSEVKFVGGEQGLLSMAFSPDYATSGRFYVYYTTKNCDGSGGCDEHVSEFTANPGRRHRQRLPPSTFCSRSRIRARATTTAASSSSAPTAISTSRWATAAAATTPSRTPSA